MRNAEGLERFQDLCDRYSICPTYLVDEPVLDSELAVSSLSEFLRDRRCEVGAHLHPWCGKPFEEEVNNHNSYLCNLPADLQRAKLSHLTNRIEDSLGHRPTSFRAGRYGLDHVGVALLVELGYLVDSSVIPFTSYEKQGGPNFDSAPHLPYFPDPADLSRATASGELLEVPVGVGFSRSNFASAQWWRSLAMSPGLRHIKAVGILDRIGIARRIKLSPEQSDAARMKSLINALLEQHAPCAVFMLHSSSLTVGTSPYARTADDLERLYNRMEDVFRFCREARDMESATLTQFAKSYLQQQSESPANHTLIAGSN